MTIDISTASWDEDRNHLIQIRTKVFLIEQAVPAKDEWDDLDSVATHFLIRQNSHIVGCARLIKTLEVGKIGRVAILEHHRRKGLATKLMNFMIDYGQKSQLSLLKLDAQTYIIPFYEELGFQVCSGEFMDAGIPHKTMQRAL